VSEKTDPQAAAEAVPAGKERKAAPKHRNPLRRMYNWVLHWAETPYGAVALFLLAFAESSFFPIPPDVLLIALAVGLPRKSFKYALVCSVGSILGAVLGYTLGIWVSGPCESAFAAVGYQAFFLRAQDLFGKYGAIAVAVAGFTPIPFKVFTITAGIMRQHFLIFMLAVIGSRSARFFFVSVLVFKFGKPVKEWIDKYFNWACLIFTVLLIGGFYGAKVLLDYVEHLL